MENFFDEILLKTHCASHVWQGRMACFETDNVSAFEPNVVHELIECYTYGLVSSGTIQIRFADHTYKADILQSVYSVFLYDLMHIQQQVLHPHERYDTKGI